MDDQLQGGFEELRVCNAISQFLYLNVFIVRIESIMLYQIRPPCVLQERLETQ